MKKATTFSLKDQLFNFKTVSTLAERFFVNDSSFPTQQFIDDCVSEFPQLELKQRISHITSVLYKYLPDEYPAAVTLILQALPPELDPNNTDNDFGEFIIAPLSEYISTYGCTEEHFELSRHALTEITKRFSVEFAVREFINTFPHKTYKKFQELLHSDNYHQRRLVSEGSRITLPRAVSISRTPQQIIKLLDHLYADPTRYVTRSVANNLNGLSKIDPEAVFETLKRREKEWEQKPHELEWIKKHALRTLLKQWNTQALRQFGYYDPIYLSVKNFKYTKKISIWEAFEMNFDLIADEGVLGKCKIDYAIGYLKKNGKHNDTVYSIQKIDSQETIISCVKRQPMKLMTTRDIYPWEHLVKILVNGKILSSWSFMLV